MQRGTGTLTRRPLPRLPSSSPPYLCESSLCPLFVCQQSVGVSAYWLLRCPQPPFPNFQAERPSVPLTTNRGKWQLLPAACIGSLGQAQTQARTCGRRQRRPATEFTRTPCHCLAALSAVGMTAWCSLSAAPQAHPKLAKSQRERNCERLAHYFALGLAAGFMRLQSALLLLYGAPR